MSPAEASRYAKALPRLNNLAQTGVLTDVTPVYSSDGPSHAPFFTCALSARSSRDGLVITATGSGRTKAAAKTDAAVGLLAQMTGGTDSGPV